MVQNFIEGLNENKFFVGMMMIFVTIGGRFIITELTEDQKKLVYNPMIRKLFIFCAFFMATRDLIITMLLTIAFLFFLESINFDNKNESFEDDYETHDSLGIFVNY